MTVKGATLVLIELEILFANFATLLDELTFQMPVRIQAQKVLQFASCLKAAHAPGLAS